MNGPDSILGLREVLIAVAWILVNLIILALSWGDAARIRAPFLRLSPAMQDRLGVRSPAIGPRHYPRKTLFHGFPDYCDPTAEERAALRRGRIAGFALFGLFLATLFVYFGHAGPVLFFGLVFLAAWRLTPGWPSFEASE